MKLSTSGLSQQQQQQPIEGEKKCLNSELWHACAGPLVSLPMVGSRVVYFPQGHSEQVAATTNEEVDAHIPNYPSLPPQLICQLHNVTMHADVETDEVYAQMTLQPLTPQEQKDTFLPVELGTSSRQPTNYFCKTLTASDTSTHGGFSVPRRAAEKVFPSLDFSQQPPAQELIARDLHDVEWKFRHIFRGQPKRHLLTTGWSVFVSAKRLVAGDFVLFIWNEKNQLLLGIRRATRPQTVMPSSVLSSDSMHIGLLAAAALAAAAHAAATNSCFTIFYNPRASPCEFVIPLSKYVKVVYHTRVSVGMRFRMLFETEESSVRRYMGTITGIGDLDPVRWPNSHWRSVKVGWDESTAGERQPRVSLWEIEPLTTFPMYPSLFPLRLKRPWYPGASSFQDGRDDAVNGMSWMRGETGEQGLHSLNFQSVGMFSWMQQRVDPSFLQNNLNQQYQAALAAGLQNLGSGDALKQQLMQFQQRQSVPFSQQHSVSGTSNPLFQHPQQQAIQQLIPQQFMHGQTQIPQQVNNHPEEPQQQQINSQQPPNSFPESYLIQQEQLQTRPQSNVPSHSFQKTEFMDPNAKFTSNITPSAMQNMLGSLNSEGSSNLLSFSRTSQPTLTEQQSNQQSWVSRFAHSQPNVSSGTPSVLPYPEKNTGVEQETSSLDAQNQGLFGGNSIDSSGVLLPASVSNIGTSSSETDLTTMPSGASGFQNSPYFSYMQDSSELLPTTGQIGPPNPNRTFVKVYKSGSVGRSLDITRFNSYPELREELGQMFNIDGLLDDPQRSGWQLVFVDRENEMLLLGDGPWEAFVNSVWYIKILSPEDVQKLGKQELETFSQTSGERMNSVGNDVRDPSGLPIMQTTLTFQRGELVEIVSQEDGFDGSYYAANIISSLGNNDYIIQYKTLVKEDNSGLLREVMSAENIQKFPDKIDVTEFSVGDTVDAYDKDGWWVGKIFKKSGSKYYVYFKGSGERNAYPISLLRVHQEWVDGKWVKNCSKK